MGYNDKALDKNNTTASSKSVYHPYSKVTSKVVPKFLAKDFGYDTGATEYADGTFDAFTNTYTVPDKNIFLDQKNAQDTLYAIALRFGVSPYDIVKLNKLTTYNLSPGQPLVVYRQGIPVYDGQRVYNFLVGKEKPLISEYASQMDNVFSESNVYGDTAPDRKIYYFTTCNVTSLAMALRYQESEEVLKNSLISILIKNGGYSEASRVSLFLLDFEDLLMYRFKQAGTVYFTNAFKDISFSGYGPHQHPSCLNLIGKDILQGKMTSKTYAVPRYKTGSKSESELESSTKGYYLNKVKPLMDIGYSSYISTNLSSSGHIVNLVRVCDDGLLINDPYGVNMFATGAYIKNSSIVIQKSIDYKNNKPDLLKQRLKFNPKVLNILKNTTINSTYPNNLGELNFYTWNQVNIFNIGKSISLLKKTT